MGGWARFKKGRAPSWSRYTNRAPRWCTPAFVRGRSRSTASRPPCLPHSLCRTCSTCKVCSTRACFGSSCRRKWNSARRVVSRRGVEVRNRRRWCTTRRRPGAGLLGSCTFRDPRSRADFDRRRRDRCRWYVGGCVCRASSFYRDALNRVFNVTRVLKKIKQPFIFFSGSCPAFFSSDLNAKARTTHHIARHPTT